MQRFTEIKKKRTQEKFKRKPLYTPNIGIPKYIKQVLTDIKGEIDRNTIIV